MEFLRDCIAELKSKYQRSFLISESYCRRYDAMIPMTINVRNLVKANKDGNIVKWEFTNLFSKTSDTYSLSTKKTLKYNKCWYDDVHKIKHEMVCTLFGIQKTDKRLDKVFPTMSDGCDHLTPDVILDTGSEYIVVEVGTSAMDMGGIMVEMYRKKLEKYSFSLETRAARMEKPVYFIPIIVSNNMVFSASGLPQEFINTACFLYRLGNYIENVVIPASDKIKYSFDREDRDKADRVLRYCGSIVLPTTDETGYDFTQSTFDYYVNYKNQSSAAVTDALDHIILPSASNKTMQECKLMAVKAVRDHREAVLKYEDDLRKSNKAPCQVPFIIPNHKPGVDVSKSINFSSDNDVSQPAFVRLWDYVVQKSHQVTENFPPEDKASILNKALESFEYQLEDVTLVNGKVVKSKNPKKRSWHRTDLKNIPKELIEECALHGLWAKSLRENENVSENRKESQKSFHPDTNTTDIYEFVFNRLPKHLNTKNRLPRLKEIDSLVKFGNSLAENSGSGESFVDMLQNTDVYFALTIISMIGSELSTSIKQNVGAKEFIYKKLRDVEVEMIVHPTNSQSHIFYSVRFKGSPLEEGVFKKLYKYGEWWYSEILSTNKSKLTNMINAPHTFLNLAIMWTTIRYPKANMGELNSSVLTNHSVWKMVWISLIQMLEDKSLTEELINGVRYISMQFLKGATNYCPPEVSGAIGKLPVLFRSRFAVFLYKQIISYVSLQGDDLPVFDRTFNLTCGREEQNDVWVNLLNPFTLEEEKKSSVVINLFYAGYTKNKDEEPNSNTDLQMVEKILGQEMLEDKKKVEDGTYSQLKPLDTKCLPGPHEWSIDFLAEAVEIAEERLKERHGENYKTVMAPHVLLEAIKRSHVESLATMKASAAFRNMKTEFTYASILESSDDLKTEEEVDQILKISDFSEMRRINKTLKETMLSCSMSIDRCPKDEDLVSHICKEKKKKELIEEQKKLPLKSCKCMEAVVHEIQEETFKGVDTIFDFSEIVDSLKTSWGGICCYLFKKMQHGGLREIYVLTMKSRVVQSLIESVFRALCKNFDEETMTHPDNKLALIHNHQEEMVSIAMDTGGKVLMRHSSEDAQKWNQNNNVNMYAFIACKLLHPSIAKLVFLGLSLWRAKKIMIPDGVMNLILTSTVLKENKVLEQMREDFYSENGKIIRTKGSRFMTCDTGMWQGILHYTSSFQHILQVMHYKRMVQMSMERVCLSFGAEAVRILSMCSSDDSYTRISVCVPANLDAQAVNFIDHQICQALAMNQNHCRFFNIRPSVKTVLASPTVGEYNSTFILMNGLYSPEIKPVVASLSIKQTESLIRKMEAYSNLLKDIYESGCSHWQTHCHQIVQAHHHYSSMGVSMSPIFNEWAASLIACPDPSLGFFIFDDMYIAGLMGYNFSLYKSLSQTKVPLIVTFPKLLQINMKKVSASIKTDDLLPDFAKSSHLKEAKQTLQEISKESPYAEGVFLSYGNRIKWKRFVRRIATPEWEDEIENNPAVLYLKSSRTLKEAKLRISAKASSAGIYESLSPHNSVPEIFASSVYCINQAAFTIKKRDEIGNSVQYLKKSLYALTVDAVELSKAVGADITALTYSGMSGGMKEVLFPNYRFYDQVLNLLNDFKIRVVPVPSIEYRKKKNKIWLKHKSVAQPIPLIEAVKFIWFNIRGSFGRALCYQSFHFYKDTVYPWLELKPDDTLKNSPFTSHKQLHDFLAMQITSGGSVSPLMKSLRSRQPTLQVIESAKYNFYPGIQLVPEKAIEEKATKTYSESVRVASAVKNVINLLLVVPAPPRFKTEFLKSLLKSSKHVSDYLEKDNLPSGLLSSYAVLHHVQHPYDMSDTLDILLSDHKSIISVYLEEQIHNSKPSHWKTSFEKDFPLAKVPKYFGPGLVVLKMSFCTVVLYLMNDAVMAIETKSINLVREHWNVIKEHLEHSGIDCNDKKTGLYSDKFFKSKFWLLRKPDDEHLDVSNLYGFDQSGSLVFDRYGSKGERTKKAPSSRNLKVYLMKPEKDEFYKANIEAFTLEVAFDELALNLQLYRFKETGNKDVSLMYKFKDTNLVTAEEDINVFFSGARMPNSEQLKESWSFWWKFVFSWIFNLPITPSEAAGTVKLVVAEVKREGKEKDEPLEGDSMMKKMFRFLSDFVKSRSIQKNYLTSQALSAVDYEEVQTAMRNKELQDKFDINKYLTLQNIRESGLLQTLDGMLSFVKDAELEDGVFYSSKKPDHSAEKTHEEALKTMKELTNEPGKEGKEEPLSWFTDSDQIVFDTDSSEELSSESESSESETIVEGDTMRKEQSEVKVSWLELLEEDEGKIGIGKPESQDSQSDPTKGIDPITEKLLEISKEAHKKYIKKAKSATQDYLNVEGLDELVGAWATDLKDYLEGPLTKYNLRSLFFNHTMLDSYIKELNAKGMYRILEREEYVSLSNKAEAEDLKFLLGLKTELKEMASYEYSNIEFPVLVEPDHY